MLRQLRWTKWTSTGQLRIIKPMAPVFSATLLFYSVFTFLFDCCNVWHFVLYKQNKPVQHIWILPIVLKICDCPLLFETWLLQLNFAIGWCGDVWWIWWHLSSPINRLPSNQRWAVPPLPACTSVGVCEVCSFSNKCWSRLLIIITQLYSLFQCLLTLAF